MTMAEKAENLATMRVPAGLCLLLKKQAIGHRVSEPRRESL